MEEGRMSSISELLRRSAARHDHLCPRQVLGVRMGLAGLDCLGLTAPTTKSDALIIVETDGCFVDGIEVSTGATVGHRSLRVVDLGKIAATFVSLANGKALRLAPREGVRALASTYAPHATERYAAQLQGYAMMPAEALFVSQEVVLDPPLQVLLSHPEARTSCSRCGEEIINERELIQEAMILCRTCAGRGYYSRARPLHDPALSISSPSSES